MTIANSSSYEQQQLPEGELLRIGRGSRWSERACGAWFLLFAGFGAAIAAVEGTVFSVVITLVFGAIGFTNLGLPGAGLSVYPHGIVIHELQWGGWIRIREWTWSEVDHFEVKRPLIKWALRVHLADGSTASAPLLEKKSVRKGPIAKAWVTELNRRAAAVDADR